jgi:hypothetical protein
MSQTTVRQYSSHTVEVGADEAPARPEVKQDFGTSLTNAVRDNPTSAALIGMGAAWLFFGGSKISLFGQKKHDDRVHHGRQIRERDDYEMRFEAPRSAGRGVDRFGAVPGRLENAVDDTTGAVGSGARQAASGIAGGASAVADAASQGYGAAASYAGDAASYVGTRASDASRAGSRAIRSQAGNVQQTVGEFFEDQPLALGVLGLVLGAGVASLLPMTDVEREYLGETSDELKAQARSVVGEKLGEAKDLASTALDEVAREAEAQGLTKADATRAAADLKDRVGNVAGAAKDSLAGTPTGEVPFRG